MGFDIVPSGEVNRAHDIRRLGLRKLILDFQSEGLTVPAMRREIKNLTGIAISEGALRIYVRDELGTQEEIASLMAVARKRDMLQLEREAVALFEHFAEEYRAARDDFSMDPEVRIKYIKLAADNLREWFDRKGKFVLPNGDSAVKIGDNRVIYNILQVAKSASDGDFSKIMDAMEGKKPLDGDFQVG